MTNALRPRSSRTFIVGDASVDVAAVQTALAAHFDVQLGVSRAVRTIWLDTPDSRLAKAGATLREVRAGQDRTLILRDAHGVEATQSAEGRWPARADQLPDGPAREGLRALAGIRALVPILDARTRRTPGRLLDSAQKAVVDVMLECADAPSPLRVDLAAVRGYDSQLERAERALRPLCGTPVDDRAPAAPPGAGSAWQVERPRSAPIAADESATRAVASVLLRHVEVVQANITGAVGDIDTEYLHDLRVATRSTRSLIKLVGDALPEDAAAAYKERWRRVGQFTTPTRDLDVLLLAMDGLDRSVDIEGIGGLAPYRSWLALRRRTEFAKLRTALCSDEFAALLRDWRSTLSRALDAPAAGPTIAELARSRIARARRRALRLAGRIDDDSPEDDLHELRKRIKEMRYLQEAFGATVADAGHKREVRALKTLQDSLGTLQDTAVLLESFDQFAATHPRALARTTMALGALADRQQRRRVEALAALPDLLAPIAHKG